ncbi:M28 family peptidase [Phytohabitans suffuscus]|uniref:Peptidase M28 domain-containing protein n=1 Tax=Phytohabitans suffuscus TaxID=624315 RepID=A0A6F8Y9V1_9ACTN|nr:M28 family peptidase [Phytohabitans suffuscus]BCB82731.1 hypothetical protein Psuf_000440 [Phytohabitans suffuscus]
MDDRLVHQPTSITDTGTAPTAQEMMGWIADIVARGVRRPGYPADAWTERWAKERFEEFGLRDVRLEPVTTPIWRPRSASLTLWPADRSDQTITFTGHALPYSSPSEGVTAPLATVDGTAARGDEVKGRIAVQEIGFTRVPQKMMRQRSSGEYDPEQVFDGMTQTVAFDLARAMAFDSAIKGGAEAYVGLLTGVPWETSRYYWPIDARRRTVPAIWLSPADGERVKQLLATGAYEGRVISDATITEETTHNVIGVLPGASDHWVIVGSHHDGPFASAVEDGSGVAMVLAQAKFWASVPADRRPHNLLFMLTTGHMAGVAGTLDFIAKHRDLLSRTVLEVHLEHVARRCEYVDGAVVPTDDPEVRWWFTSAVPALEKLVGESIAAENVVRSFLMPPTSFERMPPTDGAYFYPEGVPLVQHTSVPAYLLDPEDTLDKVHEPSLVPITRAVARIVDGTRGLSPESFRNGDAPAAEGDR